MIRIVFVRCEDCGGRGHIPIRITGLPSFGIDAFGRPSGMCGGGAVRCTCAGGWRAVVERRSA